MQVTSYQQALDFLFGRIDYERVPEMPYRKSELKLARMQQLLDNLGNPEKQLKIVHVAGTKGKGSTCAILAAVLQASGYRVGQFTSPHLHRIEERFCVNDQACSEDQFVELVNRVMPAVQQLETESVDPSVATYFEITTAMALCFFEQVSVDLAVLEVGLGGRLDSTNVCHPLVSIITSISFDHTRQLGNTLSEIANEKAGIIKPKIPVVSGVEESEPANVIRDVAAEKKAKLYELGNDFQIKCPKKAGKGCSKFQYHSKNTGGSFAKLTDLQLNLLGRHQIQNAALALTTCDLLAGMGMPFGEAEVRIGLKKINCRARIECVSDRPLVIIDAAHNVASVAALLETTLPMMSKRWRTLVFATTEGKDVDGMLSVLLPNFDHVICTKYLNNPRAVDPHIIFQKTTNLAMQLGLATTMEVAYSPLDAWNAAISSSDRKDYICVTGSFFIAAEIRELVQLSGPESEQGHLL